MNNIHRAWQWNLLDDIPAVILAIDNSPAFTSSHEQRERALLEIRAIMQMHAESLFLGTVVYALYHTNSTWVEVRSYEQLERILRNPAFLQGERVAANPYASFQERVNTVYRDFSSKPTVYQVTGRLCSVKAQV